MAGLLKGNGPGFEKVLTGSLVLHIAVITLALLFFNAPKRKIFTPVYTVDLVATGPKAKASAKKSPPPPVKEESPAPVEPKAAAEPIAEPAPPKAVKKSEPVKAPLPVKKEAAQETVKMKPRTEEKVSITDKIEEIARKKEREKEEALLSSSIDDIKKKQQEQSREVSERLEDIRKRLAAQEASARAARPPAGSKDAPRPPAQAAQAPDSGARTGFIGRSGITSENLQTQYREYYNIIHDRVHGQWIYPRGFEYEKVTVIVSIRIDRSGNLIKSWLEESSGNRSFDDSLINATRKAAPFPPLPVDLEGNFLDVGLRFCPKCPE
ncbi:MAG: cell envelope integrity protein TolA [Deltaproteobacteria bacterium]|nr:cell envelope integrity protein TolA [Deltaproteobacteria bacterium]